MHVAKIERRHGERVYSYWLVRRSVREGKRVRHETVANVAKLPAAAIEALRRALAGEALVAAGELFATERSLPHGQVQALLAMSSRLGLARLLDRQPSPERSRVLALICQQVLQPGSKLACTRALTQSTLAGELAVEGVDADELYAALDWLLERQERIEGRLARRHLGEGAHVLYDVSSSYFEGRTCPLLALGYSRDGRRGTLQIIYGLLCDQEGRPVAIEVFPGGVHDDKTLPAQVEKLRRRFGLTALVLVIDRGMVTKANLDALAAEQGIGWITALKAPQVKKLVKDGALQLSLFDEQNLAEIASDDYPGERLVVCRNPLVAAERARKREDLVQATERALHEVEERVERGTLKGEAEIGLAVGAVWNRWRVRKHFAVEITASSLSFHRNQERIAAEAALDGIYVLRTSVPQTELLAPDVVRAYKQLKEVERAFRTLKGPLELRPIHHRLEDRVRRHRLLCILAYYLAWHLRQALKPLLFDDEQPPPQPDPVAKARRSAQAEQKARSKRTTTGEPCHSLTTLLDELCTRTRNTIRIHQSGATFNQLTKPTTTQTRALEIGRAHV